MTRIIITILFLLIYLINFSQVCSHSLSVTIDSDVTCAGNDGIITVNVTGGNPPFVYELDGNGVTQNSGTFNNVTAGAHYAIVYDVTGCNVTEAFNLFVPVSVTTISSTPTCKDYLAGTINIIAQDGDHNYEYSIDGGNTWTGATPIQPVDSGNYNVIIRDGTGCTYDTSIYVGYSSIDPVLNSTPEACDGTLGTLSVSFPTAGNFSYTIDGGLTNETALTHTYTLNGGLYSFVVTNDDNCIETVDIEVDIDSIHGEITTIIDETCNYKNGAVVITANDAIAPVSYSIDNGLTTQPSGLFNNLDDGTYYVKVTDGRSCEYLDTFAINNIGGVVLNLSVDTIAICDGTSFTITSTTSLNNCTYQWANGLGTDTAITVTPSSSTNYTLIVEEPTGCKDTAHARIVVNPIPNVELSTNTINLCPYDSVLVTASGADSYLWTTGETTPSIYLKQPFNNNYLIAFGTSLGCTNKDSALVNIGGVNAQINQDQYICEGESAMLTVNATGTGLSYQWSVGISNSNSQTVTPITTTTYQVVISDFATCTDTVETTIFVDTPVNATITPAMVEGCIGEEVTITAIGATTYTWSSGETTPSITLTISGNETKTLIAENGACSEEKEIQIIAKPSPEVIASSNTTSINTGDAITFSNAGSNASYTEWDFGDGTPTTIMDNPTHNFIFQGAFNVVLTGYIGQCTDTDTLLVYVGVAGINEVKYEVKIYPNPTTDIVYFNLELNKNANFTISILNSRGETIKRISRNDSPSLNFNYNFTSLPKGFYLIDINIEEKHLTKKIIVQ